MKALILIWIFSGRMKSVTLGNAFSVFLIDSYCSICSSISSLEVLTTSWSLFSSLGSDYEFSLSLGTDVLILVFSIWSTCSYRVSTASITLGSSFTSGSAVISTVLPKKMLSSIPDYSFDFSVMSSICSFLTSSKAADVGIVIITYS